jgi:hypothetical protein
MHVNVQLTMSGHVFILPHYSVPAPDYHAHRAFLISTTRSSLGESFIHLLCVPFVIALSASTLTCPFIEAILPSPIIIIIIINLIPRTVRNIETLRYPKSEKTRLSCEFVNFISCVLPFRATMPALTVGKWRHGITHAA